MSDSIHSETPLPKCLQECVLRDWKRVFSLAYPPIFACAPVTTGSHFEVYDVSSTEAEEATEEKRTIRSFHLRFRRASTCACLRFHNSQ